MGISFFSLRSIRIGQDSILGRNIFLDGRALIDIGNHVDIASDVMIYNSEHDINSDDFRAATGSVEIGDFCFIGPRAIILPGVKIGKGAVVGAGAVVTKDVAEFTVVGGVPAEVIGERKLQNPHYKLGRARLFQ
ncbi:acyltransferase [Candidatus Daviesbacteria bacterium]|nr:acyltransferase [Candidatus Daviesbacteria bacterium]MBI2599957.1 acyltransferase [Candidatus Daviesbacteria bacterium]